MLDEYARRFSAKFGAGDEIRFVRAPGRVNLIGEHTDYNDGLVLPMAIAPGITIAYRTRGDTTVRLVSEAMPDEPDEFCASGPIERQDRSWTRYPRGVAEMLRRRGLKLRGVDCMYFNSLPVGSGLSSSAAIEVGTALALLDAAGLTLPPVEVARVCHAAEHEYASVPCGIMDQMVVSGAREGSAMLLDCRDLSIRHVPVPETEVSVVIINSMVRHELSGSAYGDRRRSCEKGVKEIAQTFPQVRSLRDVEGSMLAQAVAKLDPVTFRRCRHVVSEIARTAEAARALELGDYGQVGRLMNASHESLRTDYEVSCPELDYLVSRLIENPEVFGARMTGAGFGGCVVALIRPGAATDVAARVRDHYQAALGVTAETIITPAVGGARRVA